MMTLSLALPLVNGREAREGLVALVVQVLAVDEVHFALVVAQQIHQPSGDAVQEGIVGEVHFFFGLIRGYRIGLLLLTGSCGRAQERLLFSIIAYIAIWEP